MSLAEAVLNFKLLEAPAHAGERKPGPCAAYAHQAGWCDALAQYAGKPTFGHINIIIALITSKKKEILFVIKFN